MTTPGEILEHGAKVRYYHFRANRTEAAAIEELIVRTGEDLSGLVRILVQEKLKELHELEANSRSRKLRTTHSS